MSTLNCSYCHLDFNDELDIKFNINGGYICPNCQISRYSAADTRVCIICNHATTKFHGIEEEHTFTCSTCLQDKFNSEIEDFLNDPAHKDYFVEDMFVEVKPTCNSILLVLAILYILIILTYFLFSANIFPIGTQNVKENHFYAGLYIDKNQQTKSNP